MTRSHTEPAGVTLDQLLPAGVTLDQLLPAGVTLDQLLPASFGAPQWPPSAATVAVELRLIVAHARAAAAAKRLDQVERFGTADLRC